MVIRPATVNAYEFVVVSALRAHQLLAGCVPHVEGQHNAATMAQMEVATGKIAGLMPVAVARPLATDPVL
jgi:DNA-directed RNA polymerase subunit K/omega